MTSHVPITMGSPHFHAVEVGAFRVTEAHFPAHAVLERHAHDRSSLMVMLEGSFDVTFAGRSQACPAGSGQTEPLGEPHDNRIGGAGAHVLVVQPDPERDTLLRPAAGVLGALRHFAFSPLPGIAWHLTRELHARDTAAQLAIEGLTLELLAAAARQDTTARRQPPPWLRRTVERLHASCTDTPRLADLATDAGVHPVYFARLFRRHMGTSVAAYLRRVRLDWAAVQLTESRQSLTAVALAAGFADQSHFTRAFRRQTGRTPGRYRRDGA